MLDPLSGDVLADARTPALPARRRAKPRAEPETLGECWEGDLVELMRFGQVVRVVWQRRHAGCAMVRAWDVGRDNGVGEMRAEDSDEPVMMVRPTNRSTEL
jgi:hypothetical protein